MLETPVVESVTVDVNATTGAVVTTDSVSSTNHSLVGLPSGIDLNNSELINVTSVNLAISAEQSTLCYLLQSLNATAANSIADDLTLQVNATFLLNYSWAKTDMVDGFVNVTYSDLGQSNLTGFVDTQIMARCLASGLDGFSLAFPSMANSLEAAVYISATKPLGSFDWTYGIGITVPTNLQGGQDRYTIDVLELLDVGSLSPSSYCLSIDVYFSKVQVTITNSTGVTDVSVQPDTPHLIFIERGWWAFMPQSPDYFWMQFAFGNSSTPVDVLTLSFRADIMSEMNSAIMFATLLIASAIVLSIYKRITRKRGVEQSLLKVK